ncbi:hypothetical protein OR263_13350 [Streptomyces sp. NEAU-H22]|uniref:hypothetical protein n=1 Tax=unclassified Streptomyces TaxID=2593676 RepID=UPI00225B6C4F|nr:MULTISPECIES: hypothetical protein [unclassified Streptomyces]MCX3287674.1 hypothetical protein [Streptomyces sp. NEAU-H22]WMD04999.1 hypothetical protein Q7C01_11565 [Streptomyces sp. FXY-T5]
MGTVVLVHGIGNLVRGASPEQAAELKAAAAADRLRKGLSAAGLSHVPLPGLVMAYYAHQLADDYRPERQSAGTGVLEDLTSAQEGAAWEWLETAGVAPPREGQAGMLSPLRWAVDRLVAQRAGDAQPAARKRLAELLSRLVVATLQDTDAYTSRPARRKAVRATVAQAVREHGARVVVAHSLGSVVAYETLHAHPDVDIDLLLTLGSPLGLPAIMRKLDPEPVDGRGARPPGVRHWVNIADVGDLLAVPRELGGAFPVDVHATTDIGLFDPHTLGGYLAAGLTAAALAPHCAD